MGDPTTATCLVRAAAGLTGAKLCTWCTSSGGRLTGVRWSSTLAAASLEQPPVHVKGGCVQEEGCDVSECLQGLTLQSVTEEGTEVLQP
jgi:hypothetical protein